MKGFSQKPVITSDVYSEWPSIQENAISNDGKVIIYRYGPIRHTNNLVIQFADRSFKKEIAEGRDAVITEDSRRIIFTLPHDTLAVFDINKQECKYFISTSSFKVPKEGSGRWLAYQLNNKSQTVILHDLITGREKTFSFVNQYIFNDCGSALVIAKSDGLFWIDLTANKERIIYSGGTPDNLIFDYKGGQLAFTTAESNGQGGVLYYYKQGMDSARTEISNLAKLIRPGATISSSPVRFTYDGRKLEFCFTVAINTKITEINDVVDVDLWNYKDLQLRSEQLQNKNGIQSRLYKGLTYIGTGKVIELNNNSIYWDFSNIDNLRDYLVVLKNSSQQESNWNFKLRKSLTLLCTRDGSENTLNDNALSDVQDLSPSPDGQYLLWFDNDRKKYISFDLKRRVLDSNLTKGIDFSLYDTESNTYGSNFGFAGWVRGGKSLLLYDKYDIWKIDLSRKICPINITKGYGRINHIILRILNEQGSFKMNESVTLCAMDEKLKKNGFFEIKLDGVSAPEKCILDNSFYYMPKGLFMGWFVRNNMMPKKAKHHKTYLVSREKASESPNLYCTDDFKKFMQLSRVIPEEKYNWLTSELIKYPLGENICGEGILYKPEDFDSTKTYPIIFNYYDSRRSFELNQYKRPEFAGHNINIPTYVSNGYLIFIPNLYYKTGDPCKGIANSVVAAARFLAQKKWVNAEKMGIQGHSFGGYATNCIITQSKIFKAACEAAGPSDFVSLYGGLINNKSAQPYLETGQGSLGTTLWDNKIAYINNSPVFFLDKVVTPLLMMHNKGDFVPFGQAVELFTGLRRLGKKVWLLQYNGDAHQVTGENSKDYTVRVRQFFDYLLKDKSEPEWMVDAIPASNE